MKPKQIFPTKKELKDNPEFYKYKRQTFDGRLIVWDQDIKTGECFFCKKACRTQVSQKTILHHLKYDNSDPLAWTLEICTWCHTQVDFKNKMKMIQSRQRKWNKQTDEYLSKRKLKLGF